MRMPQAWALARLGMTARAVAGISPHRRAGRLRNSVSSANMFPFWDWVGGRYSMESAIGLSAVIAIGPQNFMAMLCGSHHGGTSAPPVRSNLPVLMGLLQWVQQFLAPRSFSIRPVPEALPPISSNSLGATASMLVREYRHDRPHLLGSRHNQILPIDHQGTWLVPCDFIGLANPEPVGHARDMLLANMFAQSQPSPLGRRLRKCAPGLPLPRRTA
jgi:glucose-6-phosphate isomerase